MNLCLKTGFILTIIIMHLAVGSGKNVEQSVLIDDLFIGKVYID